MAFFALFLTSVICLGVEIFRPETPKGVLATVWAIACALALTYVGAVKPAREEKKFRQQLAEAESDEARLAIARAWFARPFDQRQTNEPVGLIVISSGLLTIAVGTFSTGLFMLPLVVMPVSVCVMTLVWVIFDVYWLSVRRPR